MATETAIDSTEALGEINKYNFRTESTAVFKAEGNRSGDRGESPK